MSIVGFMVGLRFKGLVGSDLKLRDRLQKVTKVAKRGLRQDLRDAQDLGLRLQKVTECDFRDAIVRSKCCRCSGSFRAKLKWGAILSSEC